MDFKIVRKGYNAKEVDAYIAKTEKDNEALLARQRETIEQLKAELEQKQQIIDEFERKTKRISEAIMHAVAKAEEIEQLSAYKYEQEMEQLKSFHARWVAYYARLIKKYPNAEELEAVKGFNDKVNRILGTAPDTENDSAARFREEFSRLIKQNGVLDDADEEDIPSVAPAEFIKLEDEEKPQDASVKPRVKSALDDVPSESGFSFEEALNPTQSLEEIMADLNMIMDEDL